MANVSTWSLTIYYHGIWLCPTPLGSSGMSYCNQTLFLSTRVGSGHETIGLAQHEAMNVIMISIPPTLCFECLEWPARVQLCIAFVCLFGEGGGVSNKIYFWLLLSTQTAYLHVRFTPTIPYTHLLFILPGYHQYKWK